MAVFTFPDAPEIDMGNINLADLLTNKHSNVTLSNSTTITWQVRANETITFTGTGLQPVVTNGVLTGLTGGTITGIDATYNAMHITAVSALNLSASQFFGFMTAKNWVGLTTFVEAGNDRVTGTGGRDVLRGAGGQDVLFGAIGNDTLFGGGGADTLYGGAGYDRLVGGAGSDSLVGGNGIDSFVFNTALQTTGNTDRIGDFTHGVDRILLDDLIFKGIGSGGVLNAANFALGAATTSAHHILYNSTTGVLSYDADGVGGVGAMAFARVTAGFVVTADDFTVF